VRDTVPATVVGPKAKPLSAASDDEVPPAAPGSQRTVLVIIALGVTVAAILALMIAIHH
jgi:hypothetical protein